MSVNKYHTHLLVLPEDDANRQLANGFVNNLDIRNRSVQIMPSAGGWTKVLEKFKADYLAGMKRYPCRHMVLLVDFDQDLKRMARIKNEISKEVAGRVFVIGTWSEPEKLKANTGKTFEEIGFSLAEGCPKNRNILWSDELLRHNEAELDRILVSVSSFLFG